MLPLAAGDFRSQETPQKRELIGDCLGGYYLGSLVCRGLVNDSDVKATLMTACVAGDGTGDPVKDVQTHGTCAQRVGAVSAGMDAYLHSKRPLDVCQ